jgi:formyltetrahydrofolate deformylase
MPNRISSPLATARYRRVVPRMPSTPLILTLTCADRAGIVHDVSQGILDVGGNIVESAQFTDPNSNTFCMRITVNADPVDESAGLARPDREGSEQHADDTADALHHAVASRLTGDDALIRVRPVSRRQRVMILVSKFDHCLVDLLYRWHNGTLPIDIPVIVSNHTDCAVPVAQYGIPYLHLPITNATDGPTSKMAQEARLKQLVAEHHVDLVVLARYMQILSDDMCTHLAGRAINIHHSFLPGFKGARPYHQAHERGVKLVGATAHFVTADLDEGPIIEQDVARVDHTHTAADLVALGRDTERLALSRAVRYWAEDRIFVVGTKTVVFR